MLQVKIWFQNRRAKERKQVKKREEVVMKEKGDHASLQHAQLHHATMLHHQQMMNGMMHHHHYHQGVLQEPLMPGVPPVPLLWPQHQEFCAHSETYWELFGDSELGQLNTAQCLTVINHNFLFAMIFEFVIN